MTSDLLDLADLAGYHRVRFAGDEPGELSSALAEANGAARLRSIERLARLLPDVPHDDRSRRTVEIALGRVGEDLLALVPSNEVLRSIDDLVSEPSRLRLHRRVAGSRDSRDAVADDGSALDAASVRRALADIAALQLHDLDRTMPALADLAQDIERATGAGVRIHGFISNGPMPGLGRHIDLGELWIVQLQGTKDWTLWEPSIAFYDHRRPAAGLRPVGEPRSQRLRAGDSLVLPRGTFHLVEPTDELSVGLSIVLDAPSRARLHETYLQRVGNDSAWLEPIHPSSLTGSAVNEPALALTSSDLRGELARFGASLEPRSLGIICPHLGSGERTYRGASGGRAHPVEDLPFMDSVVVAYAGKVLRLRRRFLPRFVSMVSGEVICEAGDGETLEALTDVGVLMRGRPVV